VAGIEWCMSEQSGFLHLRSVVLAVKPSARPPGYVMVILGALLLKNYTVPILFRPPNPNNTSQIIGNDEFGYRYSRT